MTVEQRKELCFALLHADSEEQVIGMLTKVGLWENESCWRLYGDRDGNYATIGNQQSRPEASLVEKIVNCVDSRLMAECLLLGIDPASSGAPSSIRHAVSLFFEGRELEDETGGTVQSWDVGRQREQARFITLAATGTRQAPSLVIADCGEGQTPADVPKTFLSIDRSNKLRVPFVQGKFNMGGTGALKFCGHNSLQLIITRRNPAIVEKWGSDDPRADEWSFTIVRRERPSDTAGSVKNSVFRFLAPVGADENPERGEVFSFPGDELPLMPEANHAYARPIAYGSCIKLYEYDMKGFKSHVLRKDGLLYRLEILLPEVALPIRVHECRDFQGHAGSFANTLVGLTARLAENRGGNLEDGYPTSVSLTVRGQKMTAMIYAFKEKKADTYRTNEGVVFTINGQTHGTIPKTFFSRSKVRMSRLAKSLLIVVDCSKLSIGAREDLFMNSRDRLSNGELRKAIEEELEELIRSHPGLRELRERRRREEVSDRLEESKPLEDILKSILKSSPSLERLFLLGQRLSRPHPSGGDGTAPGGGSGGPGGSGSGGNGQGEFVGRPHPSFFRFHKKQDGEILTRNTEHGRRCRVKFETDVVNDYFSRDINRGRYHVEVVSGALEGRELDNSVTLHNGIANWSISFPDEEVAPGDHLSVQCSVMDDVIGEPLVNIAGLTIVAPTTTTTDGRGRTSRGGGTATGAGGSNGGDTNAGTDGNGTGGAGHKGTGGTRGRQGRPEPQGIKMPDIIEVHEGDEHWQRHEFDDKTACVIVEDSEGEGEDEQSVYTFYVNVDNIYLKTDMKHGKEDVAIIKAKFVYANVLLGLALIHDDRNNHRGRDDERGETPEVTVEDTVRHTTKALAPFLVPMIDYLGNLSEDEVAGVAQIGDEE